MWSLFTNLFDKTELVTMLLRIPCVLLAISVHESAHGWMAEKLGDPTARNMGRITLNPFRHFNLMGTLCMVLFGFGWAMPVPVNPRYFKNPKRDMAITALAGPISNILMMIVGLVARRVYLLCLVEAEVLIPVSAGLVWNVEGTTQIVFSAVDLLLQIFALLNASLAVFNLIPIPPLDGSRLLTAFLPTRLYYKVMGYEKYMLIALLVLSFTGALSGVLSTCTRAIIGVFDDLLNLIPLLRIGG